MAFSGVGAHEKNGVIEGDIQKIVSYARTMMLHRYIHCTAQFDMGLWPFPLKHAWYLWNYLPGGNYQLEGGLVSVEIYTSSSNLDISRL